MEANQLQITMAMGLSQQPDGLSLSRFVVETGPAHLNGTRIAILEVYGTAVAPDEEGVVDTSELSIRRFDDAIFPRPDKFDGSGFGLAIGRRQPVTAKAQNGTCRLIVPISNESGPMRLVVFDDISESPEIRTQALQIAELYANQVRLMDSRERDQLTGLLNRQTFNQYFQNNQQRSAAEGAEMALAVLDIDYFKRVNDTYGHLYGDEVLLHFAQIMERTFRYTDPLFRFGGEEFIVLLPGTGGEDSSIALERFRENIERYEFPGVGKVTVSIGSALCHPTELPTSVVDRADQALYFAKEHGRNQVVRHEDIADQSQQAAAETEVDLF